MPSPPYAVQRHLHVSEIAWSPRTSRSVMSMVVPPWASRRTLRGRRLRRDRATGRARRSRRPWACRSSATPSSPSARAPPCRSTVNRRRPAWASAPVRVRNTRASGTGEAFLAPVQAIVQVDLGPGLPRGLGPPEDGDVVVGLLGGGQFGQVHRALAPGVQRLDPQAGPQIVARLEVAEILQRAGPLDQAEALGVLVQEAAQAMGLGVLQGPPDVLALRRSRSPGRRCRARRCGSPGAGDGSATLNRNMLLIGRHARLAHGGAREDAGGDLEHHVLSPGGS